MGGTGTGAALPRRIILGGGRRKDNIEGGSPVAAPLGRGGRQRRVLG